MSVVFSHTSHQGPCAFLHLFSCNGKVTDNGVAVLLSQALCLRFSRLSYRLSLVGLHPEERRIDHATALVGLFTLVEYQGCARAGAVPLASRCEQALRRLRCTWRLRCFRGLPRQMWQKPPVRGFSRWPSRFA